MGYKDKQMLTDAYGKIIPQYWDDVANEYKPLTDLKKVYAQGTLTAFQTAAISVGATPIELTTGLTDKKQLIVYPPSAGTIYWGNANVTSANGAPLSFGDTPMVFDFADTTLKVYAVNDGTSRSIRVVESK